MLLSKIFSGQHARLSGLQLIAQLLRVGGIHPDDPVALAEDDLDLTIPEIERLSARAELDPSHGLEYGTASDPHAVVSADCAGWQN